MSRCKHLTVITISEIFVLLEVSQQHNTAIPVKYQQKSSKIKKYSKQSSQTAVCKCQAACPAIYIFCKYLINAVAVAKKFNFCNSHTLIFLFLSRGEFKSHLPQRQRAKPQSGKSSLAGCPAYPPQFYATAGGLPPGTPPFAGRQAVFWLLLSFLNYLNHRFHLLLPGLCRAFPCILPASGGWNPIRYWDSSN